MQVVSHQASAGLGPYVTISAHGYRFSNKAALSNSSPYFLLFGRHPVPPSVIAPTMHQVVDLDSADTWVEVISHRAAFFKRVLPMAME